MSSFAEAPTILSLDGETLQILEENTIIGSKSPPISVERAWVAQRTDLGKVDRNNEVLVSKGVNMDLATILYRLAKQENGLRNSCTVDVNGKLSCGLFHFQQLTYERECEASDFGENMDERVQVECASKMIMEGKGHTFGGWWTSWRALDLPIIQ